MVNHQFVCGRVVALAVLGVVAVLFGGCQGPSEPLKADNAETSRAPKAEPARAQAAAVQMTREQRVAELRKSLARPLSRSIEGLSVQALSNGRHAVHLEGRFSHATILRIKPDGTRERGCFDDAERAAQFAAGDEVQP